MINKYSAIVLDIDGTLLDSNGRMSDNTLYALRACVNEGILPYIATARPQRLVFRPFEVSSDADFLKERGTFYNGAVAVDEPLDYQRTWTIPAETVSPVVNYIMDKIPEIFIVIQREDGTHSFIKPVNDDALEGWGITENDLVQFDKALNEECSKIVAWHETQSMTGIYFELSELYEGEINAFITSSANWIQLTSADASKENAIMDLLALRGIPNDEVIAFGDDMPDIGMLGFFGHSVAMGNSAESVKDIAKYVTKSNDEDGIAHALKDFFGII